MAVMSYLKRKTGSMRFKIGTDSRGNDVYRTVTLNNVKESATDEDIASLLIAINGVMDPYYTAKEINKDELYALYQN